MRALIINNGIRHPESILAMLQDFVCTIVPVDDIKPETSTAGYNLVVFTGSNQRPITYHQTELTNVLTWITTLDIPTLGICYGAQLLASAFGTSLSCVPTIEEKHRGFYTIPFPSDTAWQFPARLCLYESHQWQIGPVPSPLRPLVETPRGTLLFEHKSLPIVGMQFHPDKYLAETDANVLFRLFCKRVGL